MSDPDFSVFLSKTLPTNNNTQIAHAVLKCADTSRRIELKNVLSFCQFTLTDIPEEEDEIIGDLRVFWYDVSDIYGTPTCTICDSSIETRLFRMLNKNQDWSLVFHPACFTAVQEECEEVIDQHREYFVSHTI